MTTVYKVCLEIEEIDESRDHYQTVDTPGAELASFETYDQAWTFAEAATSLLNSQSQVSQPSGLPESQTATELAAMTLLLLHGRHDPNEDMKDWGFTAAPINGVQWMHFTYLSTLTAGFVSDQATDTAQQITGWRSWDRRVLEVELRDDLIAAGGCFYGDFELTTPEDSKNR